MMNMKRRMKPKKRVSWPPDVNLCQIRMFLSDESPSQVGLNSQDYLQAKASWMLHSHGTGPNDNLPPGFEVAKPAIRLNTILSHVPVIKWKCPPKAVLNVDWQVVAGQESVDVDLQTRREMRVLEAIYPRHSAIPFNPVFPLELEDSRHHKRQIPLIPISAIEDEDGNGEPSCDSMKQLNLPMNSPPPYSANGSSVSNPLKRDQSAIGTSQDAQPDIAVAVSAALTAIMKTNEQGSMIDQNLLIQILNNPRLLEMMAANHGFAPVNPQKTSLLHLPSVSSSSPAQTQNIRIEKMATNFSLAAASPKTPSPHLPPVTSSISAHTQNIRIERMATDYGLAAANPKTSSPPNLPPLNLSGPFCTQINRIETSATSLAAPTSNGLYYPQPKSTAVPFAMTLPPSPHVAPVVSQPSSLVATSKDLDYYKTLIQQHGEQKQDLRQFGRQHNHPETAINLKQRDLKSKITTKCIYFNTSRGCRRGASCAFLHDGLLQDRVNSFPEMPCAKRIKFDKEIKGR